MLKQFWGDPVSTAAYILNISQTKSLHDGTPEEAWSGRKHAIFEYLVHFTLHKYPMNKERNWMTKESQWCF